MVVTATSAGISSRSITSPNATILVRPKSRVKSSRTATRSASVDSRTSTGGRSMCGRHEQMICSRASPQSTKRPHRPHRRIAGLAPDRSGLPNDMRCRFPALQNPPDEADEQNRDCDERDAEEPQRAIENRLRLHPRFERQRRTAKPVGQALLPDQNISPADLVGRRVVIIDLARQVQPKSDQLLTAPAHRTRTLSRRCAELLTIHELLA